MNNTIITDIQIPFGRLVAIILKFMIAAIPALILFYALVAFVTVFFIAIFGGGAAILNQLQQSQQHLPMH